MLNKTIRPARAKGTKYLRSTSSFTIKQKDKTTGSSTLAAFRIAAANFELLIIIVAEWAYLLARVDRWEESPRESPWKIQWWDWSSSWRSCLLLSYLPFLLARLGESINSWYPLALVSTRNRWVIQTNRRRFHTCVFILLGKSTVSMWGAGLLLLVYASAKDKWRHTRASLGTNKKAGRFYVWCLWYLSIYTAIFLHGIIT